MGKLIVIRGATGSGKSSVANYLHNNLEADSVLLPQDVFKIDIAKDNPLLHQAVLNALEESAKEFLAVESVVIVEGVLSKKHWHDMINRLAANNESHIFFLSASLETSIKRASQRDKSSILSENDVRQFHPKSIPMGLLNEVIIDVDNTTVEVVAKIIAQNCSLEIKNRQPKAKLFSNSFIPER